ncbi:hypothetical protein [Bradyrhizobium sp. OAE829]|uniref:hypothetical protein n=1 Tax=Bradyrhizobium sp. OAE829 TaxID=2663807 RepID=UPI00178AA4BE
MADPKHWMPVEGFGRRGEYEVSDGYVTARIGHRTARAAASSARVPASLGMEADKSLAQVLLGEIKID